jgi:hypothetical protein
MTAPALDYSKIEALTMCSGQGFIENGQLCAMQMQNFARTGNTSDIGDCVAPTIRPIVIRVNDRTRDAAERRALLWPLLPIIGDTRTSAADEIVRAYLAADWLIREALPMWMRLTPSLAATAAKLSALAPIIDRASLCDSLALRERARKECGAAAADAVSYAAAAADAVSYADAAAAAAAAADAVSYAAAAADAWRETHRAIGVSMAALIVRMCAVGRAA